MPRVRTDGAYKTPVFVVGTPRSGTTLLQAILVNSGIFFPMPETHFFYYPDARFVCLIREPKNIISSQTTKTTNPEKSIARISLLYNKIARSILELRKNDNVLLTRYEDLTNEPEQTTRSVFEFLNLPYDPSVVNNVAAPPGIVLPHETWKDRNLQLNKIQENDPDKWQAALSEYQANVVNWITKSYASKFGYVLNYSSIAVCFGMMQDLSKLASKGELRRVFSRVHG
ncbi:MAG: sulfotransferase [Deltaproteobacteria bacterium]